MKILSLEKAGENFYGWVEDRERYCRFSITKGNLKFEAAVEIDQYPSYEHFANVFAGHTGELFLQEPIPINELTIVELERVSRLISK